MTQISAVLIDTIAIQEYIFSSNRLKNNVSASYIISNIFKEELRLALERCFKSTYDYDIWRSKPSESIISSLSFSFEIGYIGGGNALILIKEKLKVKEFIKIFSLILLQRYPGLRTGYGLIYDFDFSNIKDSMKRLHFILKRNKYNYFPKVNLLKYGITAECPESGESAELFKNDKYQFISGVIKAKIDKEMIALNSLREEFSFELKDKYTFTNDLDNLGKPEGFNYISIVCIDGNRVGSQIKNCTSLEKIRETSIKIENLFLRAFKEIIRIGCVRNIENKIIEKDEGFELIQENNKIILPIRPIIIAGDNITFVCNGRLALYLTDLYIKSLVRLSISDNFPLSACAGISIVKTKYPIYRAYRIAEDLLRRAKRLSREEKNSNFIDFFISTGGLGGNLNEDFKNYYGALEGNAHFGPYRISQKIDEKSVINLKKNIKQFYTWPKNKLYNFREKLYGSRDEARKYLEELKEQGCVLHELDGTQYHISIWENQKTPYFDPIDLLEFYPLKLLEDV